MLHGTHFCECSFVLKLESLWGRMKEKERGGEGRCTEK